MLRDHNIDFGDVPEQFNNMTIEINNNKTFIINNDSNKNIISV